MIDIFWIKLITSFFVGGFLITLFTLLAERYQKIGGVIITLPSTLTISLFFIAWSQSMEKTVESINVIPASHGITLIFLLAYVHLSGFFKEKIVSIIFSASGSLLIWFSLVSILGIFNFNNLLYSLIAYAIMYTLVVYALLIRLKTERKDFVKHSYTKKQILFRGVFCGLIIFLAVFLSRALGPIWGAIFSTFPAAYLSSMIILHWYHDSRFIASIAKTVPIGALLIIIYALLAKYSFPVLGFVLGSVASYAIIIILLIPILNITKRLQK